MSLCQGPVGGDSELIVLSHTLSAHLLSVLITVLITPIATMFPLSLDMDKPITSIIYIEYQLALLDFTNEPLKDLTCSVERNLVQKD